MVDGASSVSAFPRDPRYRFPYLSCARFTTLNLSFFILNKDKAVGIYQYFHPIKAHNATTKTRRDTIIADFAIPDRMSNPPARVGHTHSLVTENMT